MSIRDELRELWQYRELLLILVQRDLKVRYKNSILGFGWSLMNPLIQVLTITMVMQFMMRSKIENYHVYVFCAMLPWLFFSTAVMDACPSLTFYLRLMRRTYFPREIVPLSVLLANLIHFLLATAVFLAYAAVVPLFWWAMGKPLNWPLLPTVFLIPIPMFGLVLLVTGLSMFVSVWTLYFEDMRYLTDSGLRILYWLVPVFYFPDMILIQNPRGLGHLFYTLYMLNPLSAFINAFRKLMLVSTKMPIRLPGTETPADVPIPPMGASEWLFLGVALLTSAALLVAGYRYFCARKWALAEHA